MRRRGLKYKEALRITYGAGLRASETAALKVSDIDSERMVIRIENGKGGKDRYAMLSPHMLELLRLWWKAARPTSWLFPGNNPVNPQAGAYIVAQHTSFRGDIKALDIVFNPFDIGQGRRRVRNFGDPII
jgi:integrase